MKYYLGIDGGGTKTKFVAADEGMNIIGEYAGPPCHYMQCGFDGLESIISSGIYAVCGNAGIKPADIAFAFAGCAGIGDIASDQPKINAALASAFGDIPFASGNDSENALAGALGDVPGINIIAGTGSIGSGRNERGQFMRCGGWHYALGGDEGSGYWIGWSMLKEYSRQSDGRSSRTLLYDSLNRELELSSDDEMVTRVVEDWNLDRTKIASLARLCGQLAKEGDPFALQLLENCAKELSAFAIVLYDKLNFTGTVPVSGTGGVFNIGPALTKPFAEILACHDMQYRKPAHSPDYGAILLAIENSHAQQPSYPSASSG